MNRKFLSLAAGLVMGFSMTSANALVVIYGGTNTYAGAYPAVPNSVALIHEALPLGAFDDTWVVQLIQEVGTESSINFIPVDGITGFAATVSSLASATCGAPGAPCSSIGVATFIADFEPCDQGICIQTASAEPGYYLVHITGTSTLDPTIPLGRVSTYTGQATFFAPTLVPEPGSLALLGFGLLGLGIGRRKSK